MVILPLELGNLTILLRGSWVVSIKKIGAKTNLLPRTHVLQPDMIFVKKFPQPEFWQQEFYAKNLIEIYPLGLKLYSISRCFSRNLRSWQRNLRDRRSHWSRQISSLVVYWGKLSIDENCLLMKVTYWWKLPIDESWLLISIDES